MNKKQTSHIAEQRSAGQKLTPKSGGKAGGKGGGFWDVLG